MKTTSLAEELRVGALAFFIQELVTRRKTHLGVSQFWALFAEIGISPSTLARISSGETRKPTEATLEKLARLLGGNIKEQDEILAGAKRLLTEK